MNVLHTKYTNIRGLIISFVLHSCFFITTTLSRIAESLTAFRDGRCYNKPPLPLIEFASKAVDGVPRSHSCYVTVDQNILRREKTFQGSEAAEVIVFVRE